MQVVKGISFVRRVKKKIGIQDWTEIWFWLLGLICAISYAMSYVLMGFPVHLGLVAATCGLAAFKIHLLGSLQEKLDKFDAENKRLEESVNKLNGLNETFQKTNAELKTNVDDLRSETENLHVQLGKMKDTISDLDTVRQAMEAFAKQNQLDLGEAMGNLKSAISEQKQLIKDQQLILNKTKEAAKTQEKLMLLQLQSQLQFFDQSAGLSRQEYDQFVMMMPAMVRQQYERIKTNFDDLDSNKDGVIDIGEFQGLVDRLVESNSD